MCWGHSVLFLYLFLGGIFICVQIVMARNVLLVSS